MYFELSVVIARRPSDVFSFLENKDKFPQKENSPVLLLEKTTEGPTDVGTRYREVVQMMPFVRGEIRSEITRYVPSRYLEETFAGASMEGYLAYEFVPKDGGTRLIQRETLSAIGFLKPFAPIMRRLLSRRLRERLESIKTILEGGWKPNY